MSLQHGPDLRRPVGLGGLSHSWRTGADKATAGGLGGPQGRRRRTPRTPAEDLREAGPVAGSRFAGSPVVGTWLAIKSRHQRGREERARRLSRRATPGPKRTNPRRRTGSEKRIRKAPELVGAKKYVGVSWPSDRGNEE